MQTNGATGLVECQCSRKKGQANRPMWEISCDPKQVLMSSTGFYVFKRKCVGLVILYVIKKFLACEVLGTQRVFLKVLSTGAISPILSSTKEKGRTCLSLLSQGLNLASSQSQYVYVLNGYGKYA